MILRGPPKFAFHCSESRIDGQSRLSRGLT